MRKSRNEFMQKERGRETVIAIACLPMSPLISSCYGSKFSPWDAKNEKVRQQEARFSASPVMTPKKTMRTAGCGMQAQVVIEAKISRPPENTTALEVNRSPSICITGAGEPREQVSISLRVKGEEKWKKNVAVASRPCRVVGLKNLSRGLPLS